MVPRVGQHDAPRARQVEAEPEESVVGSDEVVASRLDGDRPAGAADPRIHDRQMHRAAGEVPPRGLEEERRPPDVLRRHRVGQIDEPDPGVDREENALDGADVRVIEPEVGEQGDDAARAARARCPAPRHRSRWITYSAIRVRISRAGEPGNRPSAAMPVSAYAERPRHRVADAVVHLDQPMDLRHVRLLEARAAERLQDARPLVVRGPVERDDQGQGALALQEVVADRLAEPGRVGGEVQRVVDDLERDADALAVRRERLDRRRRPAPPASPPIRQQADMKVAVFWRMMRR